MPRKKKQSDKPEVAELSEQELAAATGGGAPALKSAPTKPQDNDVLQQEWSITYESIQRVL